MMRLATRKQFALYRFPQPDEPYDLLMLNPISYFIEDGDNKKVWTIPLLEHGATSAPDWVPDPEIISADYLEDAARQVNNQIARRIGAVWHEENLPDYQTEWRDFYQCRWCASPIRPIYEDKPQKLFIWLSIHNPHCAVLTNRVNASW